MPCGSFALLVGAAVTIVAAQGPSEDGTWIGREATRSRITHVDVDGGSAKVVLDSPNRGDARERGPAGLRPGLRCGGM